MERENYQVKLQPFVHQVGGSSCVLSYDAHTLCKPLNPREHHFYETMPLNMKEFTPEYRGVVEVEFLEDVEGYVNLMAYPIMQSGPGQAWQYKGCSSTDTAQSDSDSEMQDHRNIISRSNSIETETNAVFEVSSSSKMSRTYGHNPWSVRCHQLQIAKMKQADSTTGPPKFILLENLASNYKFPCILDLKMGTQQHGDDSTEEKRQIQIDKCKKSTSSTLGVRICGMQVYQVDKEKYICHDKYYGRQLTVQGFYQCLYQFLHNGITLRTDLIDNVIKQIKRLRHILEHHDTFRFYSSSLLLMYDGSSHVINHQESCQETINNDSISMNDDSAHSTATPSDDSHDSVQSEPTNTSSSRPLVDVRMIDFAHSTHKDFFVDDKLHHGPDKGYLFGLDSLITALHRIRENKINIPDLGQGC